MGIEHRYVFPLVPAKLLIHVLSGPLINLHFFSVTMLRRCTLHILNLTLLGVANGSVLFFGVIEDFLLCNPFFVGLDKVSLVICDIGSIKPF